MRLDKYLSNAKIGSRKEVGKWIRKGLVTVNGGVEKNPKTDVSYHDEIYFKDDLVKLEEFIYIMMNKPKGVISSTEDGPSQTVIDLIDHPQKDELFPVGRLDKDTTGLMFITNDGKLAHRILSPKNEHFKTYHVTLRDQVSLSDIKRLEEGIELSDFTTKRAVAEKVNDHVVLLSISEGKFHQVKRMFGALDNEVIELKRISMSSLELDESLSLGEYRFLTEEEMKNLSN
ncbi:pseudouridine synthase [Jeotgalicoccus meleagridis]|uniref:Pseudouridine synthase n=1 Tax=Jeotgalicoccus meleagridis TaxID=2759181 RepID=A0A6V7RHE2_9STAP|nr:pseudouridine synthase [Jeotgalicoccus meleagridis]CAD2076494.1 Ribosomal small subunit pseudouridine synthase A [Jeotgalicoccus meleagridis]